MFEQNFDAFVELLDGTLSLNPNWKPIPAIGKALFFKALEPYTLDQVSMAMTDHVRDTKVGMFQPTPAHLIAQIEARAGGDGRLGVEEAWAHCLKARDEDETVVWTREMQLAFEICRPSLDGRANVAARMAFKEAYERLICEARREGRPLKWEVSLGRNSQRRETAIQQAVTVGRLPAPQAAALLPNYSKEACAEPNPEGLKKVKEMLAGLQAGWAAAADRRAAQLQADREAEQAKKQEIAARVEAYKEGGHD